jgi:polyisoprenyl-phosphate glycosyltransferase
MISLLIPVYNESENIFLLLQEIKNALGDSIQYQVLFVDDGSTDNTLANIKALQSKEDNVFYISFSRNFGHQNALRAGLEYCNGDAVISLDGDLQHPPTLIPKMISLWQDGHDVVFTTRLGNKDISFFKRWTSDCFYTILNLISEVELKRGAADFRLLDKKVVKVIREYREREFFLRGVISSLGFKQCNISYVPNPRASGKTKYSMYKMIKFALNGITSFSILPLRIATFFGFTIACCSFIYGLYAVFLKISGGDYVSGWVSIMAGVYFMGGIQLIALGICGEYIGRIMLEVKGRPNFIIRDASLPCESRLII